MSQFVTQERRLITLFPWLGARENILGQKARQWLQYSSSLERIKNLLQSADAEQQFTLSAHSVHHPRFSELVDFLILYKNQITLQISQIDLHQKSDLFFSLAEIGFEIEIVINEPANIETQIVLSRASYQKTKFKILALVSQHYSVRDVFESLYLSPQTPITLFFSNTTCSEDWLYLSPSQAVIRSEEAHDCLNRLGQQNVKISTFSPNIMKETAHQENPFLKNFTAPSVSIWTLSAIGSLFAILGQYLFAQAANVLQIVFSEDLTQTRMYWNIKNRVTSAQARVDRVNRSTVLATKKSATKVRHSTFMFFNPIYWNLYSLTSKMTGHSRFYSTIMYWKSFRVVQAAIYILKQLLLPFKYTAEFIFYTLRHLGFTVLNRTYWALYRVFANVYGLARKAIVFLYWQLIVRVANLIYRPLNYLYWRLYSPALTLFCALVRITHIIQRPFKNLFWIINNVVHVLYYKAISLVNFSRRNLIPVYWYFYKLANVVFYKAVGLKYTIQRLSTSLYWFLYGPTLRIYEQIIHFIQFPFKYIFWRTYGVSVDFYYLIVRIGHFTQRCCSSLYWKAHHLLHIVIGQFIFAAGQLARLSVFIYWLFINTLMILAWPLRKIYWFSRFQYYKRIRKQAYEN